MKRIGGSPIFPGEQSKRSVDRHVVGQLLRQHGCVPRKALKKKSFKQSPDRSSQFEHIAALIEQYRNSGQMVFSMDTTTKELPGSFYSDRWLSPQETIEVLDPQLSELQRWQNDRSREGDCVMIGGPRS